MAAQNRGLFCLCSKPLRSSRYGRAPRLVLLLCGYHAVLARPRLVHVLERNAITVVVTFSSILVTHLHFHRWATQQVLDETAPLTSDLLLKDLKGSFPGIYDTIVHLYQSDAIWLRRLEGRPTGTRDDYEAPGCMYELRDAWLEVLDRMIAWADGISEQDWSRELSYANLAGVPFKTPLWQMVLHIVNHRNLSSRPDHFHAPAAERQAAGFGSHQILQRTPRLATHASNF